MVGRAAVRVKSWLVLTVLAVSIGLPAPAVAESSPRPWAALLTSAEAIAHGDWAAARQRLEAVDEAGQMAEVKAALGLTHLVDGQLSQAAKLLEAATADRATLAEAHCWRAVVALRRRARPQALRSLDAAVALAPARPELRLARGLTRAGSGDRHGAVDDLLEAARRRPNLLEPSYHPDPRSAMIALVDEGLRRFPDQGQLRETTALIALEAGLWREAERRASGDRPGELEVRGRLALYRGDEAKALGLLERAAAASPRSSRRHFELARAAFARGRSAKALAALRRAAELNPSDTRVQVALGDLALEQGDLERAELAYGYALSRRPDLRALIGLGRLLELQGDLGGAERQYRRALSMAPVAAEALERLARLLERREPVAPEAKALRQRLATVTAFERRLEQRVSEARAVAKAHAEACELIDGDPAAALRKLAQARAGRAAIAFARAAALNRQGEAARARTEARRVLSAWSAERWARGAPAAVSLSKKIGRTRLVRRVTTEFVRLP